MATKKTLELDERVKKLIDETFSEFERYLPGPQAVNVYRRKRKEYWDKITARITEEALRNVRADDTGTGE